MLDKITTYIPTNLIYATSYSKQWKALCEKLSHSVVVTSPVMDHALIGLWWNEFTHKIFGYFTDKFSPRKNWCLAYNTLDADLPIDLAEVSVSTEPGPSTSKSKEKKFAHINLTR